MQTKCILWEAKWIFFFFTKDRPTFGKELRKSQVKNTLELTVKVATVSLKFKKAFPWVTGLSVLLN